MTPSKQRLAVLLAFLFAPAFALADIDTKIVDCSRGGSIQEAVGSKGPGRPLTVIVRGTCMEDVEITRDDVSLLGEGGIINGSVRVDGARRLVIADLSVTNPGGDGVTITNGGSATVTRAEINDSFGYGLFLRDGSFAVVKDSKFLRNGIVNPASINDASGIAVSTGSVVRASGNKIAENANAGIEVFDSSFYRSEGDEIAMRASAPGRSAVDAFRRGHIELRGATVSGNVFVNQQSHLQMRNAAVQSTLSNGHIAVSGLSFLRLRAGIQRRFPSTLSCNTSAGSLAVCVCDDAASCAPSIPAP